MARCSECEYLRNPAEAQRHDNCQGIGDKKKVHQCKPFSKKRENNV